MVWRSYSKDPFQGYTPLKHVAHHWALMPQTSIFESYTLAHGFCADFLALATLLSCCGSTRFNKLHMASRLSRYRREPP